jgi:hypothetical protein
LIKAERKNGLKPKYIVQFFVLGLKPEAIHKTHRDDSIPQKNPPIIEGCKYILATRAK